MYAAIYFRTDPTSSEASILQNKRLQQLSLIREAARLGYTVYAMYVDENIFGSNCNRPSFCQLLKDAYKNRFQAIFCLSFYQLSSDFTQLLNLLRNLSAMQICILIPLFRPQLSGSSSFFSDHMPLCHHLPPGCIRYYVNKTPFGGFNYE